MSDGCTKDTCPASYSIYGYAPSWDFNLFFTIAFSISGAIFVVQAFVWPKWRVFSWACALGSFMEVGGYVGRLLLHNDPFSDAGFKLNVILLTVAPAFVSAAIYLTLKKATCVFGQRYSILPPAYYAYIFVGCDIVSIILQGAGGAISAIAENEDLLDDGVDIMIAGLAFQVFTLLIFLYLAVDFVLKCFRNRTDLKPGSRALAKSVGFQVFVAAVSLSFICILTRCCYRAAELSGGWGNEIMRKEAEFVILDSDMCIIAFVCLNIFHPGYLFDETGQTNLDVQQQPMEMRSEKAEHNESPHAVSAKRQAIIVDGPGPCLFPPPYG
ncbi:RTA1 like protein family [Teratosphaeria nubilosa]|uniref:RTA1 like protein family n=1 Tax=Teratosphaeria nubilosa TaxID=161662 RepID=A0A6G1L8J5_9PEZI|nr:RTA1 like protein family [Teratosphaeria nubilosa]